MGIILGFVGILTEGGNGYIIAVIIVGFFSWLAGPIISTFTYGSFHKVLFSNGKMLKIFNSLID